LCFNQFHKSEALSITQTRCYIAAFQDHACLGPQQLCATMD
jgi:hypothetical protein